MDSSTGLLVVSSPGNGINTKTSLLSQQIAASTVPLNDTPLGTTISPSDSLASLVISTLNTDDAAGVDLGMDSLYKGLSISTQEIVAQLNEILQGKLPEGLESVSPEDATPEKTATTIVQGITSLFSNYLKSNPELSPEEALTRFLNAAREGVDAGYQSAFTTLEGLGAFSIDGIQSGIEETKALIEQKLQEFESAQRASLGIEITSDVEKSVNLGVLTQAGVEVLSRSDYTSGTLNLVA